MKDCTKKFKCVLAIMLGSIILTCSSTSRAELSSSSILAFDPGNVGVFTNVSQAGASYFTLFEGTNDLRVIGLQPGPDMGVVIDTIQTASGNHQSPPGSEPEFPGIDAPWELFSATGMHLTTAPITVINGDVNNDGGFTKLLDFGGWSVIYSLYSGDIPLNGDPANFPGDTGLATITCTLADCAVGSTFTLDYDAHVGDFCNVFPFCAGVNYRLHLQGEIASNTAPEISGVWNGVNTQFLFIFGKNLGGSEVMVNNTIMQLVHVADSTLLIVQLPSGITAPFTVKVTTPSGMDSFPKVCPI